MKLAIDYTLVILGVFAFVAFGEPEPAPQFFYQHGLQPIHYPGLIPIIYTYPLTSPVQAEKAWSEPNVEFKAKPGQEVLTYASGDNESQCREDYIGDGECDLVNNYSSLSCGPNDGGDCNPRVDYFDNGECDEINNWEKWINYPNGPFPINSSDNVELFDNPEKDENGLPKNWYKKYDGGDCTCDSSQLHKDLFSSRSIQVNESVRNIYDGTFEGYTLFPDISKRECNYMNCVIETEKIYTFPPRDGLSVAEWSKIIRDCGEFDFTFKLHEIVCSYEANGCKCQEVFIEIPENTRIVQYTQVGEKEFICQELQQAPNQYKKNIYERYRPQGRPTRKPRPKPTRRPRPGRPTRRPRPGRPTG